MNPQKTEIIIDFDMVLVYADCKKTNAAAIADLFDALSKNGTNIDLISLIPPRRATGGLSFSVFNCDFTKVLRAAAQLKNDPAAMRIEASGGYVKITLQGAHFSHEIGIASGFFSALKNADSETMLVSATNTTISALIRSDELDKAVSALEKTFPNAETIYQI